MASVGDVDNALAFPLWILIGPALIQESWQSHLLLGGDCAGPLPVSAKVPEQNEFDMQTNSLQVTNSI